MEKVKRRLNFCLKSGVAEYKIKIYGRGSWNLYCPGIGSMQEMEKDCFIFDNLGPKIIIEEIPQGKHKIYISYQISILEETTAKLLMEKEKLLIEKLDTKGRMKKRVRRLLGRQC